MYLYNENILECAQIARSGLTFMILEIEGLSSKHTGRNEEFKLIIPTKW